MVRRGTGAGGDALVARLVRRIIVVRAKAKCHCLADDDIVGSIMT
jgi:hypothetical protein